MRRKRPFAAELDVERASQFQAACGNDAKLWERVRPFAGLVRNDTFDHPVVITKGSVFVTEGTDRRSSGTHYTPTSLTEPIVRYTLEPLVFVGPAEGKPNEEWKLRSPKELLDLKICDMACGSGAFLVQACRYMAERLVEAWEETGKLHPDWPGITPFGEPSTGDSGEMLIPKDTKERMIYAPPHRGAAVPVRRGQEPAGCRHGEAQLVAVDDAEGQAVHVPRPRHPVWRFAGRHRQHASVDELLARRQRAPTCQSSPTPSRSGSMPCDCFDGRLPNWPTTRLRMWSARP